MKSPFWTFMFVILACSMGSICLAAQEPAGVLDNFILLMKSSWKDMAMLAGGMILKIILAALLGVIVGFIMGVLLYLQLRKHAMFAAPWRWYRFASWVWAPLFAISLAVAIGIAGAWFGGGKAVDQAITRDHVIRKVVANLYCAVALDRMDYKVKGAESVTQIHDLLANGDGLVNATLAEIGESSKKILKTHQQKAGQQSRLQRFLLKHVADRNIGAEFFSDLLDADARLVVSMVYMFAADKQKHEEYVKANPRNAAIAAVVARMFDRLEKDVSSEISSIVWLNVFLCILLGLALPLGLLALLRGTVYFVDRRQEMATTS